MEYLKNDIKPLEYLFSAGNFAIATSERNSHKSNTFVYFQSIHLLTNISKKPNESRRSSF